MQAEIISKRLKSIHGCLIACFILVGIVPISRSTVRRAAAEAAKFFSMFVISILVFVMPMIGLEARGIWWSMNHLVSLKIINQFSAGWNPHINADLSFLDESYAAANK